MTVSDQSDALAPRKDPLDIYINRRDSRHAYTPFGHYLGPKTSHRPRYCHKQSKSAVAGTPFINPGTPASYCLISYIDSPQKTAMVSMLSESEADRPASGRSCSSRQPVHREKHSSHGDVIRDVIIGFADGVTVPFALTAGLSSSVAKAPLV